MRIESWETLQSKEDDSVNFVGRGDFLGFFETRYVRRDQRHFAVYLSSQSGCKQACRMCYLTVTKQTFAENADFNVYFDQALAILNYYDKNCPKAEIVHFDFLARGEPLDNPLFLKCGEELLYRLGIETKARGLISRFIISTILPKSFADRSLSGIFSIIHPEIYYSIYSIHEGFRKKWLPKAMPLDDAIRILQEYQRNTKMVIKLHWAFIEGENDNPEKDIMPLCWRIKDSGLRVDIVIIPYNPYSEKYGRESSEVVINQNIQILRNMLPFSRVKIIGRVGRDVKAPCGMFVEPNFSQS